MSEESFELATKLGEAAKLRAVKIATAESCTGGLISATITEVAGSSAWFDRGFVTYTPESKMEILEVRKETLENYGVVSEETAREMALGAIAHSKATLAVSVTGVAGPTGGTEKTPVGTVCFGFAFKTEKAVCTESATQCFKGGRTAVRKATVEFALKTLIALLT